MKILVTTDVMNRYITEERAERLALFIQSYLEFNKDNVYWIVINRTVQERLPQHEILDPTTGTDANIPKVILDMLIARKNNIAVQHRGNLNPFEDSAPRLEDILNAIQQGLKKDYAKIKALDIIFMDDHYANKSLADALALNPILKDVPVTSQNFPLTTDESGV